MRKSDTGSSSSSSSSSPTFNIALMGPPGVGKTSFISALTNTKKYTGGAIRVTPMGFYTNKGPVTIKLWDYGKNPKFGDVDGIILLYNLEYYLEIEKWIDNIRDYQRENLPMVIAFNKFDFKCPDFCKEYVDNYVPNRSWIDEYTQVYSISTKSHYNISMPILGMIRSLLKDQSIVLTDSPCTKPSVDPKAASESEDISESVMDMFKTLLKYSSTDSLASLLLHPSFSSTPSSTPSPCTSRSSAPPVSSLDHSDHTSYKKSSRTSSTDQCPPVSCSLSIPSVPSSSCESSPSPDISKTPTFIYLELLKILMSSRDSESDLMEE